MLQSYPYGSEWPHKVGLCDQEREQHYFCVVLAKHKLWSIYFVTLEDTKFFVIDQYQDVRMLLLVPKTLAVEISQLDSI